VTSSRRAAVQLLDHVVNTTLLLRHGRLLAEPAVWKLQFTRRLGDTRAARPRHLLKPEAGRHRPRNTRLSCPAPAAGLGSRARWASAWLAAPPEPADVLEVRVPVERPAACLGQRVELLDAGDGHVGRAPLSFSAATRSRFAAEQAAAVDLLGLAASVVDDRLEPTGVSPRRLAAVERSMDFGVTPPSAAHPVQRCRPAGG